MSYINQIVEDGVTYDIAAKNLVNGFTQTTAGVNALDAAAGKSLNDSLANTERMWTYIGSNASRTLTVFNDTVNARLVAIGHVSYADLQGIYMVNTTRAYTIVSASGITITVSNNDITIANSTGYTCQVLVI